MSLKVKTSYSLEEANKCGGRTLLPCPMSQKQVQGNEKSEIAISK